MKKILKKIIVKILIWEARAILNKYQPKIILVGGDVGKTTTKDATYEAVKNSFSARKSTKSLNSETGLPLSIIGKETGWRSPIAWIKILTRGLHLLIKKQEYPELLVLELGDGKPGDTLMITKWLEADVLILTKVDDIPSHVEFFDSIEGSRKEKSDLIKALKKDGTLITNTEDVNALKIIKNSNRSDISVKKYGTDPNSNLQIKDYSIKKSNSKIGLEINLSLNSKDFQLFIPGYLGSGVVHAISAGILASGALGSETQKCLDGFEGNLDFPRGRLRVIPGVKKTILIDDTYNAGHASTKLALDTLKSFPEAKRRIALLADMLELGKHSQEAHEKIGVMCPKNCDILITVGDRSRTIAETAKKEGMRTDNVFVFSNSREAGKFAEQLIKPGDVVLIKGSQGLRMERATQEMMLHPEEREKLLVRQSKGWIQR